MQWLSSFQYYLGYVIRVMYMALLKLCKTHYTFDAGISTNSLNKDTLFLIWNSKLFAQPQQSGWQ